MSRLKSRLDKLDGGAPRGFDVPISFHAIEDTLEWPDEVGDFATTQFGVFYRNAGEGVDEFLGRVQEEIGRPRSIDEMTDEELENSIISTRDLLAKIKPEFRKDVREHNEEINQTPEFAVKWEDEE